MRPGRAADQSPPSSCHRRVELYLCLPSGPYRACNGITLPIYIYIYIYTWVFPGYKVRPERAADLSPPSSACGPHRACKGITLLFTYINVKQSH